MGLRVLGERLIYSPRRRDAKTVIGGGRREGTVYLAQYKITHSWSDDTLIRSHTHISRAVHAVSVLEHIT